MSVRLRELRHGFRPSHFGFVASMSRPFIRTRSPGRNHAMVCRTLKEEGIGACLRYGR